MTGGLKDSILVENVVYLTFLSFSLKKTKKKTPT